MRERRLPNGQVAEFPDWMSDTQISSAIEMNFPSKKAPLPEQSLMEKVKRYGLKNPAAGATKALQNISDLPPDFINFLAKKMGSDVRLPKASFIQGDTDAFFGLPEEKNAGDIISQLIPEIAGAFAVPSASLGRAGAAINKLPAGKYLSRILGEAAPQAAYSSLVAPSGDRGEAGAIAGATSVPFSAAAQLAQSTMPQYQKAGSILGGLLGGTGAAMFLDQAGVPGYINTPISGTLGVLGKKALGTRAMMMQELAGGKDAAKAQERLRMAKELGLDFLTPEEAFNSPFLSTKQGRLGRSEAGSELLYEKFGKRIESEQRSIDKVLKQIHDPKVMGPQAAALYKEAYEKTVPNEVIGKISGNKVINKAINEVNNNPVYQESLKNAPTNSIAYLDHVKIALDDMIESAPKKEARIIRNIKNDLLKDLDAVSPEYKQARGLEERKKARQGLEKAFDKTDINSGHAFYKALNSKEKFDKLMINLREVPEAQEKLKYMRELFKDFRAESKINKVRGLTQTGMKQDRNDINAIVSFLEDKFAGGKFDVEAIEFITDPNWDKKLAEINKISDGQKKVAKFIQLFGKGASQATSGALTREE